MSDLDKEIKEQAIREKLLRLRYYQGIKNAGEFHETFIAPPKDYWISSNIFSLSPNFGKLYLT
jgi:hypothetical protein